jgi:capsular exopolysaccharide synthesis family protein
VLSPQYVGDRWTASAPPQPEDARLPLGHYARVLRDRWRIVAASFLVVTAAVAVGVSLAEPVYRAIGTIEIRKQAAQVVPVGALFQSERISDQYLETQYGTLRSRALIRRTLDDPSLAARLRLALDVTPEEPGVASATDLVDEMEERVIVSPSVGSRIVRIGFDSPDPALSADVVNALIDRYGEMRRAALTSAVAGLDEQVESVRTQLLEQEQDLQAFVHANDLGPLVIAGTGDATVLQERLRRLEEELTEAEADDYRTAALSNAAQERESLAESAVLRDLRIRIAELRAEYAAALATMTDNEPRTRELRSQLAPLDSLVALEQQRVSGVMSSQHEAAVQRRDLLQTAVDGQRRIVGAFATRLAEYDRRHREVESLKQLYKDVQQKRREAVLTASLSGMDVAVLERAEPPRIPQRPRPKRDLALAALTGLLLGIGLAFLREYSDERVRGPDELGSFGAVPLLGSIPTAPLQLAAVGQSAVTGPAIDRDARWHRIDDGRTPDPTIAEAFRGLRASVLFGHGDGLPRTLLVTSSAPGDGKTTVSANLAISLAMLGHRVLLVDGDMRRPSLHRVFGVKQCPGVAEHLQGELEWRRARHREVRPGLDVLTAGLASVSASDLLAGGAVHHWLGHASVEYDFVIFDSPPLDLHASDARILAHAVEGVLLVVRSGSTRGVLRRAVGQTPNLTGIVLNQVSPKRLPAYDYDRDPTSSGDQGVLADAGPLAGLARHGRARIDFEEPEVSVADSGERSGVLADAEPLAGLARHGRAPIDFEEPEVSVADSAIVSVLEVPAATEER